MTDRLDQRRGGDSRAMAAGSHPSVPAALEGRGVDLPARVRVVGKFVPDEIQARAGRRLRLVVRREDTGRCSEQLVIPRLGTSVMLPPFEDVVVELGPLPAGELEFRCGLGVLRGRIVVAPEPQRASIDVVGGRIVIRGRGHA